MKDVEAKEGPATVAAPRPRSVGPAHQRKFRALMCFDVLTFWRFDVSDRPLAARRTTTQKQGKIQPVQGNSTPLFFFQPPRKVPPP